MSIFTIMTLGAAVVAAVCTILRFYLRSVHDRREPPLIDDDIPYVKPALGMLDNQYFLKLRNRYGNLPICTLQLPGMKLYVVNDPKLLPAIQRNYKALTFQMILDKFAIRIADLSSTGAALLKETFDDWIQDTTGKRSPSGSDFMALHPGESLDEMNRFMLQSVKQIIDDWVTREHQHATVRLQDWVRDIITKATTEGVYGSENPYREAKVRDNFWTYSDSVGTLAMGRVGKLLAPRGVKAFRYNSDKFAEYFISGTHEKGSALTRQRYGSYKGRGFPMRDIANLEVAHALAILSNTVPTAFWFILHIFSDTRVKEACLAEINEHVTDTKGSNGQTIRTLDVLALKSSCPLLQSTFKETMRFEGYGTGMRSVNEEHLLDGKWLLRKGSLIFMPATVFHYDESKWGGDVSDFKFDRFVDPTRPRVNNNSFRGFGGGTTLCPGRHFATTEVYIIAAMLLLRFDITPANGVWQLPSTKKAGLTVVMPPPDADIEVRMKQKEEDKNVKWVWKLTESEHAVMMENYEGDEPESGKM